MLPSTSGRHCLGSCSHAGAHPPHLVPRSVCHSTATTRQQHQQHTHPCAVVTSSSSVFGGTPTDRHHPPPQRQQRACRVVACSSAGADRGPTAGRDKQQLERELKQAISVEDYAAAAALKKQLQEIEQQDPLVSLQAALDAAVAEERYDEAAQLRDQMRQLAAANQPLPPDMSNVTAHSDVATHGIRVKVRSYYVPAQSRPELGQFFFAYRVTISNESEDVVMLLSRHWVITDANGKVDHVRGPGVIGQQPILSPGRSFEYQSACPLFTPRGTMEGGYEMAVLAPESGEWDKRIEVAIGRFGLIKPEMA